MPNFNPNDLNKYFDQTFGKGSFNQGIQQAYKAGQLKQQASLAKSDFTSRLNKLKTQSQKKTYQDALDYWNQNKDTLNSKGAYRTEQEWLNDPNKRQAIKDAGFNQKDFIDAMYATETNGNSRSKREYNQQHPKGAFNKNLQPYDPMKAMNGDSAFQITPLKGISKNSQQQNNNSGGLLDKLKNSEVGRAVTAAEQFFNPFDNVSADKAVKNYLNHKQSNTFQEVARGANRAVDSASLGLMSNLDKKVNNRTPYYNSPRKLGEGGGTDMITSGLGYLVPGVGATKAVKALGLGAKEATGLAKLGQLAKEGAITGGALTGAQTGINYALNPKDQSLKNNLENIGLGIGLGAVGDPLLHGLGGVASKQWGKLATGEVPTFTGKPSEEVLSKLLPKTKSAQEALAKLVPKNTNNKLFNDLITNPKTVKSDVPKGFTNITAAPKTKVPGMLPPSELDNHGYGLFDTQAKAQQPKPNPLDVPYKPGDVLPNTISHIGTKTEKTLPGLADTVNKGYIKTVDNLHRLNQFDNHVQSVLGRVLKPTESTHTLGLNSRSADVISKQNLTENMVNKNGDVVGQSLKDITMKVPKGKLKDFEDYLVNKHAITRMGRGEKVFPDEMKMTTGKSQEIVKQYEQKYPQFKDLANQYYDYNKQLGQHWLVDTGILSKDQWEGYLKENPHYVPNNRIFSDLERSRFTNNAKKGFANQSNPVKKAIGSQRKIVSPIESTIEHTAQYVKTAKRNEVMQTLINNIKQNPEAFKDWAEIVPTKETPQSVKDMLNQEGISGVLDNVNKGFDQKPDLAKGNIIRGLVDGKPVHVKVNDPHLLNALTNLSPKAQNIVIHSLGQVTRVMKNLTTGINPVFSLTRNVFRDIPTAFANSKTTNNPLKFAYDLLDSFTSVMVKPVADSKMVAKRLPTLSKMANNRASLYKEFKNIGGGHSSPISSDVNLLAQSKQSILPQKGLKPLLHKGLGALENLNNAVEAAPRLAEFKRIAKNGDYNSKMKALYEANDVTVNFNKYGNVAKEIDSVIPYFNAAVQGLDKLGRVFFSPNASAAEKTMAGVKAFSAITIPSILLYTVNHNNPDYQKVSNYIKDTNFLIPKGDGTFYKIPKPRELGVIFGSDVERALRAWEDNDPNAFQDFATTLWDNFSPPVRTIVAPINDLRANKNYMDAPIIPGDLQNVSPQYQYDSKTSEVSKKLGSLFGFSPMKADYLAKSYGGVLGELGIPATAKDTTIGQTLKQKVTVDPVFSNDLQRRFYDMKTKLDQAHYDLTKQGVKNPNLNEPIRKSLNKISTEMGKVRKEIKQTQGDNNLSPQQRLDKIRKLQDFINQLAQTVR